MSEPREFWLYGTAKDTGVVVGWDHNPETHDPLHVIEKFAYDQVVAENESAQKIYAECVELNTKHKAERDALKIDHNSWQNCQRKLKEANERIVEFERIKAEHLREIERLKRAIKSWKAEEEDWYKIGIERDKAVEALKFYARYKHWRLHQENGLLAREVLDKLGVKYED